MTKPGAARDPAAGMVRAHFRSMGVLPEAAMPVLRHKKLRWLRGVFPMKRTTAESLVVRVARDRAKSHLEIEAIHSALARERKALRVAVKALRTTDAKGISWCQCGCGDSVIPCALKRIAAIRKGGA